MHRSASVKRPLEVTRFEEDPSFQSSAYKAIKLEAEMSENQRLSPKLSCSDEKSESAWRPWWFPPPCRAGGNKGEGDIYSPFPQNLVEIKARPVPSKNIVVLFAPPNFVSFRRLWSLPLFLSFRLWLSIFYLRYDPIFIQRPLCDISDIINMKNTNCHPDPILSSIFYFVWNSQICFCMIISSFLIFKAN